MAAESRPRRTLWRGRILRATPTLIAMNQPDKPVYYFGPFRYDSGQRLLFRDDETVPLAPKVAETLRVFLEAVS